MNCRSPRNRSGSTAPRAAARRRVLAKWPRRASGGRSRINRSVGGTGRGVERLHPPTRRRNRLPTETTPETETVARAMPRWLTPARLMSCRKHAAEPEMVEVWRPGGRSEERRPRHDRNRHRHGHQDGPSRRCAAVAAAAKPATPTSANTIAADAATATMNSANRAPMRRSRRRQRARRPRARRRREPREDKGRVARQASAARAL